MLTDKRAAGVPGNAALDAVFAALADPTRRAIVERLLAHGELTVGELAQPFTITTPAISRHLRVLEQAGLLTRRVEQQWRYLRVREDALASVESWISRQRRHWNAALDRLEAVAASKTPRRLKS
jgi:DNA-binding transcriptional ArsR family regulator